MIVELLKTKFGVLLRVKRYGGVVTGFAFVTFVLKGSVYYHWFNVVPPIEAMVEIFSAFEGLEQVFGISGEDE